MIYYTLVGRVLLAGEVHDIVHQRIGWRCARARSACMPQCTSSNVVTGSVSQSVERLDQEGSHLSLCSFFLRLVQR